MTKSLRFIALFGTIISTIFFVFFKNATRANQIYSYYGLFIVGGLTLFSCLILRKYVLQVLKNLDLLIPAGVFLAVSSAISLFPKNAAENVVFTSLSDLKLINFQPVTFQLAALVLLNFFNAGVFIGWTTKLLLDFAKSGKADLLSPFEEIRAWLPKAVVLLVLKFVVILLSVLAFFPLLFSSLKFLSNQPVIFYLLVPVIGLAILLINLATAALLPHLLNSKTTFAAAFRKGIRISWANKSRTLLPVLLLLICCGWMTFIRVYYIKTDSKPVDFGSSFNYQTSEALKVSFNFNNVWASTYPSESFWHSQLLKAVEEESFRLNEFRIALLLIFFSIVVNLAIIKICLPQESASSFAENDRQKALPKNSALVTASLILCFLPVEKLIGDFSSINKSRQVPFNSQIISGQNNFKKELLFETGQGGTVELKQDKNSNETLVRHINDLIVKDFKDGAGRQIVVSTGSGILFLDLNGAVKKSVPIEIVKTKETEGSLNESYFSQKIVEINEKGDLGVVSYQGSSSLTPGIFDLEGKMILPFTEDAGEDKTISVYTGDVDRNGTEELYKFDDSRLQRLDLTEIKTEKFGFKPDSTVFKSGDELNLLVKSSQSVVENSKGEQIKKISKPISQFGYFSDENGQPRSLFLTDNHFGVFDLNGKLLAKYAAPLSQEDGDSSDEFPEVAKVRVFQAQAQPFIAAGRTEYLAVTANISNSRNFVVMLYIYDGGGQIVYQEVIADSSPHPALLPAADSNNGDSLLIYTNNKIWKYTKQ